MDFSPFVEAGLGDFPISPSREEIGGALAFTIIAETSVDVPAREALLDRAMGPKRRKKSSEKLRRGRRPSEGLAFVARDTAGTVVGTVRLWDVAVSSTAAVISGGRFAATLPSRGREASALLLGPLAVDPSQKSAGIGSALVRHAIAEARRLGHGAILLVGDAPYYGRFGFSAEKTGRLAMPGPYEQHRLLALELREGALDEAAGTLRAAGRKLSSGRMQLAA
jgi:predicted N-acetyltransferase YhbS